jgi:hypothetical protein
VPEGMWALPSLAEVDNLVEVKCVLE